MAAPPAWPAAPSILPSPSHLAPLRTLAFSRLVLLWMLSTAGALGTLLYLAERRHTQLPLLDALFLAASGVSATGFSSVDMTRLRPVSKALLGLSVQLGSRSLLSLVPVVLRLRSLRRVLPPGEDATFDLRRFRQVPQWLVEYKALVILLRVVLAYHAVVYAGFSLALTGLVAGQAELRELVRQEAGVGPLGFGVFHTLSAFCNVGFTLQATSFVGFAAYPGVVMLLALVCLLGNVLFPVVLRWVLIVLNFRAKADSSRKIYFRYLLLHGRDIYANLFMSQQTWILLITQVALIAVQMAVTWASSAGLDVYETMRPGGRFPATFFMAVNTRHAGMTVLCLRDLDPSVLVLYTLMMLLAPVPFMVVLRSSTNASAGNTQEMLDLPDNTGGGLGAEGRTLDPSTSTLTGEERRQACADDVLSRSLSNLALQRTLSRPLTAPERGHSFTFGLHGDPAEDEHKADGRLPCGMRRRASAAAANPALPPHAPFRAASPWPGSGPGLEGAGLGCDSSDSSLLAADLLPPPESDECFRGTTRMMNVHMVMRQKQIQDTQAQLRLRMGTGRWREDDYLTDTRVLLMVAYPNEKVPYHVRVTARAKAVSWHLGHLLGDFSRSTAARDLVLLWVAWYLVCATAGHGTLASSSEGQFAVLFELVSAYGNVGLSLGSEDEDNPHVSFSATFSAFGKAVVIGIIMLGALRGLPLQVDSVLAIKEPPPLSALLRQESGVDVEAGDGDDAQPCHKLLGNRSGPVTDPEPAPAWPAEPPRIPTSEFAASVDGDAALDEPLLQKT